jgi:hypothetical protein
MLIVNPWHWLTEHGNLPDAPPRLRANALKVARLIEYGGPLAVGESRETLIECSKRPNQKHCPGLLWVTKTSDNAIHAGCIVCKQDEMLIHNWEETEWANGPMDSVRIDAEPPEMAKRFKRPYPASIDQVHITRQGDEAIIEYAESNVQTTHIKFGPEVTTMSNEEILERHNEILVATEEVAEAYHHVAVEIPYGKPQIERFGHGGDQWVPRGGVLRCAIDDGGTNGEAIIHIDDHPLSMHDFGRILTTWAGWGMRVLLVPDDELMENPDIEVREPKKGEE